MPKRDPEEEFDDEEEYVPKKSKFPWKGVLKGAGIMVVVVTGLYLVNQGWGDVTLSSAGFVMLCLGSALINLRVPRKKKIRQVFSLYRCNATDCGIKELHEFKDGDFVYKEIGPCFKCDGLMYIEQIFSVKTREEERIRMTSVRDIGTGGM